jgi:fructose-1,6-bisphosphatase/inositol monophosphatase family enzyme
VILDPALVQDLELRVADLMRFAATTAIMPRFGQLQEGDVFEKTPGELVTIADRESEQILKDGLLQILPEARVVAEEACASDETLLSGLDEGLVWIVDPLDGTANFASAKEPFGLIVALAYHGEAAVAWLHDPVTDRMCFAAAGGGARMTVGRRAPQPLSVQCPDGRPIASLATQFMPAEIRDSVIASAETAFDLQPIPRCAAEHYPRLCLGENHVAMFQRTLPWDHAAGALLLTEAGGFVARWNSAPYHFHDEDVGILAATSFELWTQAAEVLFGNQQLNEHARTLLPQELDRELLA